MSSSTATDTRGFTYYLLLLGARLLRFGAARAAAAKVQKDFQSLRSDVSRTRIEIPTRDKGRTITVDVYEKVGEQQVDRRHVHLNLHGSGFIIPSLGSDIDFCALLASKGVVVFDADYRKAPENPFPAAYQDVEDLVSYLQAHASDFDVEHLTISGFSAGAGLAMANSVNLPPGTIAGVVSFYGNPDMARSYPAPDKIHDGGVVLPGWLRSFFYKCLILPGQDRTDSRLSAAYASIERWPKHVYVACGAADNLHDAGQILVKNLKAAGHEDVEFLSVEHEAHAFDKAPKKGSLTEQKRDHMYHQAIEVIQRAHGDGQ